MSEEKKKRDRREIQRELLSGDLYQQLIGAAEMLRHRSEYDVSTEPERRLSLLCWAIEKSAEGKAGTCVTMYGIFEALREVVKECSDV